MVSTFRIQADRTLITDEKFEKICRENSDRKFERTAKLGHIYDSSTGFRLSNGAIRSPDAAWVSQSRWDTLTLEQRKNGCRSALILWWN